MAIVLGIGEEFDPQDPMGLYKGTPGLGQPEEAKAAKPPVETAKLDPAPAEPLAKPASPPAVKVEETRPSSSGRAAVPEDYYSRMVTSESGGRADAKNPKSTATGLAQITVGTWADIRRKHPELKLTEDGRTDPAQSMLGARAFTEDNADALHAAGIPIDKMTLYSAHFLGAGGAKKVLRADPSTKMDDLVGPAELKANPFLSGMSVSDFRTWAAKKGGAPLSVGQGFKSSDPMGLYRDGPNPFAAPEAPAAASEAPAEVDNSEVDAQLERLNEAEPNRYKSIGEEAYEKWKADWEAENRSTGIAGDTKRLLTSGFNQTVQAVGDVAARLPVASLDSPMMRKAIGMLPDVVNKPLTAALDYIDEWVQPAKDKASQALDRSSQKAVASLTPETIAARGKDWVTESKAASGGRLLSPGPAWMDPRSYFSGLVESVPGTVLTMVPSMRLASGAFKLAILRGATKEQASAIAARTATLAGGVTEGMLGGAQSAQDVRATIKAMPRELLEQSEAVKQLVVTGMSMDEAIDALADDAASQAFVLAGVATGVFGGMGDRALSKILTDGVSGGIVKRIAAGAGKGIVGEGVFEEAPQEALSQVAKNKAMQTVNPDQDLMEGVANAAAGGMAVGGVMGAGFGAVGGAASPGGAPAPKAGPLTAALEHGEQQAQQKAAANEAQAAEAAARTAVPAGAPEPGSTVKVEAEGIEPFMARVDGYENGEAVLFDASSGEVYQVPVDSLIQIAPAPIADQVKKAVDEKEAPAAAVAEPAPTTITKSMRERLGAMGYDNTAIREMDPETANSILRGVENPVEVDPNDAALEPADPKAADKKAELPPIEELKPASQHFPGAPTPGSNVIVKADGIEPFSARVLTYVETSPGEFDVHVADKDGKAYDVPYGDLYVSNLTKKQADAQELARNPAEPREQPEGSTVRKVGDKSVTMPDDKHARLFDLGKLRRESQRTLGASSLDRDGVSPAGQEQLANEFGVTPAAMGQIADDYRFRVERAAKQARSDLPTTINPVNAKLLQRMQGEKKRVDAKIDQTATAGAAEQSTETPAVSSNSAALDASPDLDTAAHQAATSPNNDLPEPTQAQKEAGNYKVGHHRIAGLDLSIENPAGSTRSGTSKSGKAWSITLKSHYGYIKGTVGRDKDHIDIFVKPGTAELPMDAPVFVVDQVAPGGRFDEHKVMLGFANEAEARAAYLENYSKDWKGLGAITETRLQDFKAWLKIGRTKDRFARAETAEPATPRKLEGGVSYGQKVPDVTAIDPANVPNPVNGLPLEADPENTLCLLACGSAKIDTKTAVPLLELYKGPIWQDLRANGKAIPDRNKFVLSGKHGFGSVSQHALPYEEKISAKKVDDLIERGIFERAPSERTGGMAGNYPYGEVARRDDDFKPRPFTQVIIYGSGDYRRAFNALTEQLREAGAITADAPIVATEGSILKQRKQFNEYLRAAQGQPEKASGSAKPGGVTKTVMAEDSNETVEISLTAAGPWDFADTYPLPSKEQVERGDVEGRDTFTLDDAGEFDPEEVASVLDEAIQELIVHYRDIMDVEAQIVAFATGTAKFGNRDKEKVRKDLLKSIAASERAIDNVYETYVELFGEKATLALLSEGKARARQEERMTDKGVETPRIPKKDRDNGDGNAADALAPSSKGPEEDNDDLSWAGQGTYAVIGASGHKDEFIKAFTSPDVTNARLLELWRELVGSARTGASFDRGSADAAPNGMNLLYPGKDGRPRKTMLKGKDLAEAIREGVGAHRLEQLDNGTVNASGTDTPTTYDPAKDRNEYGDGRIFPAPAATIDPGKTAPRVSPAEAAAELARWKAVAKKIGATGKNANKAIISLFDDSGSWSQPFRDAGYTIVQFDLLRGNDIFESSPMADISETLADGKEIVGVLSACPCTTFAVSGARWWEDRHNAASNAMVEKLFGPKAARHFDTPVEANSWMVHMTAAWVDTAEQAQGKPLEFHALENPIGRIGEMSGLPKPLMRFDPHDFGDPYTKRTQLWGNFKTDMPTAEVDPIEGSKIQSKLRGDKPEDKRARSKTPDGFAYAFFMAQDPDARLELEAEATAAPSEDPAMPAGYDLTAINMLSSRQVKDGVGRQGEFRAIVVRSKPWGSYDAVADTRAGAIAKALGRAQKGQEAPAADNDPYAWQEQMQDALKAVPADNPMRSKWEANAKFGLKSEGDRTTVLKQVREAAAKPSKTTKEGNAAAIDELFASNKLFTADKVEAARKRLKEKMGRLNSGIDPELLVDGMTIAGAYIEAGVRNFADYAGKMTADFGDSIRPYMLSFWEGARNYPGLDTKGMTSPAESAKQHAALMAGPLPASEAAALGSEVKAPKRTKRSGRPEDRALTQDWGVEHIDGYGTDPSRETGNDVKDAFLKDASGYLKAVASILLDQGYTVHADRKGKPMKPVSVNESGAAGSGDVSLTLRYPETGANVYVTIGDSSLRGVVPMTPSGIAVMFRASKAEGDTYGAKGINRWAPVGLSAGELAAMMHKEAGGGIPAAELARPAVEAPNAPDPIPELDPAGKPALEGVPSAEVPGAPKGGQAAGGDSPRGGADLFGDRPARAERAPSGRGLGDGEPEVHSPAAGTGNDPLESLSPAGKVDASQSIVTPAADQPVEYTLSDDDELGAGGQKAKFRQNVAAIHVLRRLEAENRPANRDEQTVLAKWVGWGGLRAAFAREDGTVNKGWDKEAAELKELLTADEFAAAESSTRNAHYTSAEIVQSIWKIATRLGFKGGRVLEPSIGAGNFIGMMPGAYRSASHVTGVELDAITGGIAKNLYPKANIKAPLGFEKITIPAGHFDLAIGNPPFGSERLYDPESRHLNKFSIHNFFFAKSIDALRPGGVLAMVITNYFLDAKDSAARAYIAEHADLVGAIRLPNNAFQANAGTEVTTDIIVLRKRLEGEPAGDARWLETGQFTDKDGGKVPLNRYFMENPGMMLGEFGAFGTQYRGAEAALVARKGDNLPELLEAAVRSLPAGVMPEPGSIVAKETVKVPSTVEDAIVGSMFLAPDGTIYERRPDSMGEAQAIVRELEGKEKDRVAGMIRVRDAFTRLRRAQISETSTDKQLDTLRAELNKFYDAFTRKNGPINQTGNRRLFGDDPTWPQISALEDKFDKGVSAAVAKNTGETARPPSAKKAQIFTKRTQQPYSRPTTAASAKDALSTVLADRGRVDMDALTKLYGKPEATIVDELGNLLFKTPAGEYVTADDYLSGNVKAKLAEAIKAAEDDSDMRRNVQALKDVIPADIEPVDIDVKAGAPWIPANHIAGFAEHVLQTKGAKAFFSKANARWQIELPRGDPAAQIQWGTTRATVNEVVLATLNGSTITIRDKMRDGTSVLNQAETDAANEKVERVKTEWNRWLWDDDARRDELSRIYNDTFNTDVLRQFDGSHLTLPGKVDFIKFRPHQLNFVWRALQSNTTLADHVVGAGKTFALIASIMEMRRIGQAKKPMLVVPNHLVSQWATDFITLYPGAKVLAATKKDFDAANRKRLFARVATGDWDAVIVAHSSFGRIGVDPEFEAKFIKDQVADLEQSITELRQATGEKSRNVAQLTKWRDALTAKLQKLIDSDRKDEGLTFDEMGVDALAVDEAHEFKNLAFATSMTRVAGLGSQGGSLKAQDLYIKIQSVKARTGGRNIIFATGTPISNTMAEMYTMQRYMDGEALKSLGVSHFDAWARVFGEIVSDWELSPSGTYKLKSRFAKFVNIPELMQRYRSFADVITNDDIKAMLAAIGQRLPLPKVKGGKPNNIVVERSKAQAAFIGEGKEDPETGQVDYPKGTLVYRAENLPKKPGKGEDNMLKVMSDARKAALDMRLIDPSYPDEQGSKVHVAADNITRLYKGWHAKLGTQLVFIDLSTPKKAKGKAEAEIRELVKKADAGDEAAQEKLDKMSPDEFDALTSDFSVYDDLRAKLNDRGIPDGEIAFIHDANTDLQKAELFAKVNSGRIRVLFGSTAKMGAGTNVQQRMVALHHLDAPWRPSDLEQRDGRGIRQGNHLEQEDPEGFELEILRYATEKTLDARMWQTIEGKAKFIGQVRKGGKDRVVEDIGGEAMNSAEMKAAASGNPIILEEMDLRSKMKKLQGRASEHDREQHRIKGTIRSLNDEKGRTEARLPAFDKDSALAAANKDAEFSATIRGAVVDKPAAMGEAIIEAAHEALEEGVEHVQLGTYAGFKVAMTYNHTRRFSMTVTGDREHHVGYIDDVETSSPLGTAMKIVNTVRKDVLNTPAEARQRIAEIEKQLPGLEKQLGEWPDTTLLEAAKARHAEVLQLLRPKEKAKPAALGEDYAVVEPGKRPSFITDPALKAIADKWAVWAKHGEVTGTGDSREAALEAHQAWLRSEAPKGAKASITEAPAGWDVADAGTDRPALTEADRAEITNIVKEVSGLEDVTYWPTIALPEGAPDWGTMAPSTAGGFYHAETDLIVLALDSATPHVAYHEAFHRLQNLFMKDSERAVLKAELGRLRRMVASRMGREHQASKMSRKEVEAEAFGIYATGDSKVKPHKALRAVWDRMLAGVRRVRNLLAGRGFQTSEDVFARAKGGKMAKRPRGFTGNVPAVQYQAAFHGSPHHFDRFDVGKIGTGEGNQAFGWGLYFAAKQGVAEHYRRSLTDKPIVLVNGNEDEELGTGGWTAIKVLEDTHTPAAARRHLKQRIDEESNANMVERYREALAWLNENESRVEVIGGGALYKVDVPEDSELMLWDAPLNGQTPKVREALLSVVDKIKPDDRRHRERWEAPGWSDIPAGTKYEDAIDAGTIYRSLHAHTGNAKAVSEALRAAGIPGHRYLDGGSRSAGDGSYNYVIYDDSRIAMLEQYSINPAPPVSSPAFKRWFGNSKVVDAAGKPLVVYHGTYAQIEAFDPSKPSITDGGMSLAAAGVRPFFFTSSQEIARDFAGEGGNVVSAYLHLKNPLVIDAKSKAWYDFHDTIVKTAKEGTHDGLILRNLNDTMFGDVSDPVSDVYIALEPTQIKSATGNNGNFDPSDPRISYSVNPAVMKAGETLTENRVTQELKGKLTDLQPTVLATIPLNYFTELAQPNMTSVGEYLRVKRIMDAYRGKKHAEMDVIAQGWLKLARLGKDKAGELASLMHDATLAGTDPSETSKEVRARPNYEELRRRFVALPPAMRSMFVDVRDAYKQQADELDRILLDNVRKAQEIGTRRAEARYKETVATINERRMSPEAKRDALEDAERAYKSETTKAGWSAKARITKMRLAFEASRVETPYFPLARFGRYFVAVRDLDGTLLSFSKREKAADRDRLAEDMRKAYPTAKVEVGVSENGGELRSAMDPRIVAEIEEILGGAGVDSEVMDMVWQRYLESMPDLSTRKRFIHRKGVPGFEGDALRTFSSHMFHASHQMGRLKYGLELQELTNEVSDQAREARDTTKAMTLSNELRKRHKWVMNPTGGKVAQIMTSTAFVWYLAASPASALVNMTQTPMLGIPMLAGRFGSFAKAAAAIGKASYDTVGGRGSMQKANLTNDEHQALAAFYESGLIDRTQSHDIAGVGETGVEYSPVRAKVMATMSWMFHHAEVWNREVTAIAAYRMARDAGENQTQAIDTAHDITWKSHFDYSNSSRPRIQQNDFAKVALVFRAHNINMLYRVFRDAHQAFKGSSPQIRREARYQLAGIVGMMSLMAGVSGTIGFHVIMALAGAIFGDDDDPMDFEQRFKADVLDILGPELGGVVLNGVPGHYLGVDLTSRIGMPDLWFRSPYKELEGRQEFEYWVLNSLGASVSMIGGMVQGFSLISEGQTGRGIEAMMPKWAKDLMKSARYVNEGVTSLRGDAVVEAENLDAWDIIAQTIGFTPAKVSEAYERNSALKGAERRVLDKRQALVNAFALAARSQDAAGRADAIEAIKRFNKVPVNRGLRISADTLRQSMRVRARNAKKREDGVLIQNRDLGKQLREALPEPIYR